MAGNTKADALLREAQSGTGALFDVTDMTFPRSNGDHPPRQGASEPLPSGGGAASANNSFNANWKPGTTSPPSR